MRRALYRFVAARPDPVTRDDAATALDLPRHVAKFHLERLVADGLLAFEYRRPPGRSGPGAGRPAKRYSAVGDVDVTLPERRYDLAGQILVRAVAAAARDGVAVADAVADAAYAAGRALARGGAPRVTEPAADDGGTEPGAAEPGHADVLALLASCGFEPRPADGTIVLTNCPFRALADMERTIVCGMNLAFVRGVIAGAHPTAGAVLAPGEGRCCVTVTP